MVHRQKENVNKEFVPVCHGSFFHNSQTDSFIEIQSCKSFSKSSQKKLKLISQSRSLEKSVQFLQQKRKIKPLKLRVAYDKQQQQFNKTLCSIKGFKQKINKITQESTFKPNNKHTTLNTDISENNETSKTNGSNQNSRFHVLLNSNQLIVSIQNVVDPFPTLGNSLVVKESSFNPESLLQSVQNTHPSIQASINASPTHLYKMQQQVTCFLTPVKERYVNEDASTRQRTWRKQKLTLNNARKVETYETLKTENDGCHSVTEENEYKRFFDNIAFPQNLGSRQCWKSSQQRQNEKLKSQFPYTKLY